jgi:hypothetical protein
VRRRHTQARNESAPFQTREQKSEAKRSGAKRKQLSARAAFVAAPTGFSIVERDGEQPHLDAVLRLDDVAYRIVAVRRSPFPRDPRPCLVLEPQQ